MNSHQTTLCDYMQKKQLGEKGQVEYSWSNQFQPILSQEDKKSLVTQFFYQLNRTNNAEDIETQLHYMLSTFTFEEDASILLMLYKIIAQTRDIIAGKGEYNLAFIQLAIWYQYYPDLTMNAFKLFVDCKENPLSHQYGSWKDIKYMCEYLAQLISFYHEKDCADFELNILNEFLSKIITFTTKELKFVWEKFQKNPNIPPTLIGRWLPREKSNKFGWIHQLIAKQLFPEFTTEPYNGWNQENFKKARLKQKIYLTKILVSLSKATKNPQINFCDKDGMWSNLDFNKITSITLRKQKNAILNLTKKGNQRSEKLDRINCAKKYKTHIEKVMSGDITAKIHGKRCNVGELVKDALTVTIQSNHNDIKNTINSQWESNKSNNKGLQDKPIIAMCDTSGSMEQEGGLPLYNAMGLSLRISELSHRAFRNRIMTFSAKPTWVKFNGEETFVEKVNILREANWGCNTDFYLALDKIIEVLIANNTNPKIVKNMLLAVFSDMQFDDETHNIKIFESASEVIARKFYKAGLQTSWATPYDSPHILFWNLRKTTGFPATTFTNNITFLSGYNSVLLNIFCEKGLDSLRQPTPFTILEHLLNNPRYEHMTDQFLDYFQ